MQILITGGTGAIGQILIKELLRKNHKIIVISRNNKKVIDLFGSKVFAINWAELHKVEQMPEIIIHLAGHNLGNCFWTKKNKQIAYESRVKTANILTSWCAKKQITPRVLHASGVSYYGFFKDCKIICNETTPAQANTKKFAQELAFACENAFADLPKTTLRLAPVLNTKSGMLAKLAMPAKYGLASIIGNGLQPLAWVAIEDVIAMIMFLLERPDVLGPINLTSPEIIDQKTFTKKLALALARPAFFRVPAWLIKLLAGELGDQFIIHGQAVAPDKLIALGYKHKFSSIDDWFKSSL